MRHSGFIQDVTELAVSGSHKRPWELVFGSHSGRVVFHRFGWPVWSDHGLTECSAKVGTTFQNFLPDLVPMRKGIFSSAGEMESCQSLVSSTSRMHVLSWTLIVDSGNYCIRWVQSWWVSLKMTAPSCSDKFLWKQPVVQLSEPFWPEHQRLFKRCPSCF